MSLSGGRPVKDPLLTLELPGIPHLRRGKVRELFDLGDALLLVATDRISAFDCILPTGIPDKGRVLNSLSAWWFQRLRHLTPNHVLETDPVRFPDSLKPFRDTLRNRSMVVRKTEVLPIECVARGYLIGSGWAEYQSHGTVSGIPLRAGYRLADRLNEPIFTPARKAESGHDENITFEEAARIVGSDRARHLRDTTLALYRAAAEHALRCGIILADTKFEFGLLGDEILLIDEALTPDSSRFWDAERYRPGSSPASFDKQFVRDHLESLAWDKRPPAPALPDAVVHQTADRYREAYRRLTGQPLPDA